MKKFKVYFYYSESGYTFVKAKNKLEAEDKLNDELADKGLDDLKYEVTDRSYGTT